MSRNLRAVKVQWGPHASLFLDPEDFERLITAIIGDRFQHSYVWNTADEVYRFWVEQGDALLDLVRDCDTEVVIAKLPEAIRKDAELCLKNLKVMEPDWRSFLCSHGELEIWVDGC